MRPRESAYPATFDHYSRAFKDLNFIDLRQPATTAALDRYTPISRSLSLSFVQPCTLTTAVCLPACLPGGSLCLPAYRPGELTTSIKTRTEQTKATPKTTGNVKTKLSSVVTGHEYVGGLPNVASDDGPRAAGKEGDPRRGKTRKNH